MKGIVVDEFGGAEVMKIKEMPELRPGSGEILIRIKAAGVNPVDTYIRTGTYPYKPKLPYTPGLDAAGTVEALGDGVKGQRVGARVYCSGTLTGAYAQAALCKTSQVHPLPDHITFSQGAGVNVPYATAYRALFHRARAQAGETLLVHGASGGVGVAAVQFGRAAGLRVIGTAGTERGAKLAEQAGAHKVFDHAKADYLADILKETGDKGADVILEMLANVNLNKDLTILAMGGRVVVIGSRGKVEIDPRLAMGKDGNILGMTLMIVPEKELASIHAAIVAGLENRTLNPVVGREFPLSQAPQAQEAVLQPGSYGKIVLIP